MHSQCRDMDLTPGRGTKTPHALQHGVTPLRCPALHKSWYVLWREWDIVKGSKRRKLLREDGQGGPHCSMQVAYKGELESQGKSKTKVFQAGGRCAKALWWKRAQVNPLRLEGRKKEESDIRWSWRNLDPPGPWRPRGWVRFYSETNENKWKVFKIEMTSSSLHFQKSPQLRSWSLILTEQLGLGMV